MRQKARKVGGANDDNSNASDDSGTTDATNGSSPVPASQPDHDSKNLRQRLNVYLVIFGFVILIAGAIFLLAYLQNKNTPASSTIKTQTLNQSTLNQVANSDATVGSSQTVLNVESSAVFAGQVLIRQNLQVAGGLEIGGTTALTDLSVSGTGQFSELTASKDLAIAGDAAIQGTATISKSLQVNGNGTFSGPLSAPQVTTPSLQLNGDLVLTHHISIGGATPSRSNGPALGSGGSVSISGSDTGGSITINTGGSPPAGCFVTITFTAHYNSTPHVLVSPVGSAAGGLVTT